MRTLHEELIARLRQDFSAANLGSAATLAHEASFNASNPLGLFIVTTVLRHLQRHWDEENLRGQAWMTQSALTYMEDRLRPPLLNYLEQTDQETLTCSEKSDLLNAIVRALFKWTVEGPDPHRA